MPGTCCTKGIYLVHRRQHFGTYQVRPTHDVEAVTDKNGFIYNIVIYLHTIRQNCRSVVVVVQAKGHNGNAAFSTKITKRNSHNKCNVGTGCKYTIRNPPRPRQYRILVACSFHPSGTFAFSHKHVPKVI